MPTGFATQLRAWRHPIVAIAVWLMVLQGFLAGLASVQAIALLGGAPFEAGTICHGAGGSGSVDAPGSGRPDSSGHWNVCCAFCASASPAAALAAAPTDVATSPQDATRPVFASLRVTIAHGAVRAGFSQAPPSIA